MTTAGAARRAGRSARGRAADRLGGTCRDRSSATPPISRRFAAIDALVGHGGIVVFDETVDMAEMARFAMEFCALESCGKCTPCRIGSTPGGEVIDRIIANRERAANVELLRDPSDTIT